MEGCVEQIVYDHDKHKSDVTCLAFMNNYVFSGGQDGFVKVWDENLVLKNSIDMFGPDHVVYAMCADVSGRLYASGSDGRLKCLINPLKDEKAKIIYENNEIPIESLYCIGDSVWAGDGIGVVMNFVNFKKRKSYEMYEEMNSLAVDGNLIYSIRDSDLTVTEIYPDRESYTVKAVVPGKSPMKLFGPYINARRSLIVCATRDGKGLNIYRNDPHHEFSRLWHKDNAHDMIIYALSGNEKTLFTGSYDGVIKIWDNIADIGRAAGEFELGECINVLCHGQNDNTVYVGSRDGKVRRVLFS